MPSKMQSAVLAGVAAGVIASLFTFIPVLGGCLACLVYIVAGIVAVWHYTNTYELTIPGGQGAGMGALAATIAGVISTLLTQLFIALGIQPDYIEQMRQQFAQSGMDPDQQEQIIEMFSSPVFMIGSTIVGILIAAILGAVGGAIGASIFKKGNESPDMY